MRSLRPRWKKKKKKRRTNINSNKTTNNNSKRSPLSCPHPRPLWGAQDRQFEGGRACGRLEAARVLLQQSSQQHRHAAVRGPIRLVAQSCPCRNLDAPAVATRQRAASHAAPRSAMRTWKGATQFPNSSLAMLSIVGPVADSSRRLRSRVPRCPLQLFARPGQLARQPAQGGPWLLPHPLKSRRCLHLTALVLQHRPREQACQHSSPSQQGHQPPPPHPRPRPSSTTQTETPRRPTVLPAAAAVAAAAAAAAAGAIASVMAFPWAAL
mmetsp:Transcript_19496/g.42109  ORF Transcript_19496/g.42109 Transcript_19496/m.42109 type:complete len:267 (-) Transcript_19496:412-1212(-)